MSATPVGAVLVAAGRGARMRDAEPKQFRELGGRALMMHALRTLCDSPHVASVVVVVPEEWETRARQMCAEARLDPSHLSLLPGGATRQESVRCGVRALPPCSHVLVHDAARPFVSQPQIERVVAAAREHGAASLAFPVRDTLVRAVVPVHASQQPPTLQQVDREGVWAVQTPQVFERELLLQAHEHARAHDVHVTDDGGLVLELGRALQLVAGSWWNIKVTTPDDWERARWILQSGVIDADA